MFICDICGRACNSDEGCFDQDYYIKIGYDMDNNPVHTKYGLICIDCHNNYDLDYTKDEINIQRK